MIQNFTDANTTWYWGFGGRVVPCTRDAGACAYLESIYSGHEHSMLFVGIFWASLAGLVLVWALARLSLGRTTRQRAGLGRLTAALAALARRHLLRPAPAPLRRLFGHTTRLQLLILAVLAFYLAVLTFAGHVWGVWYSPAQAGPAGTFSTRSTLGPLADRLGVLAYALTPLAVLLAQRESLLALLTGVPASAFVFLHRWTGHLLVGQSLLHVLGWVLIEAHYYQPQPAQWQALMRDGWMRWGWAALAVLLLLWAASLGPVVRRVLGHEAWRKGHYVLGAVYMGAAIAHWPLLQCFLVPGLALWGADRAARAVRTAVLHGSGPGRAPGGRCGFGFGFAAAQARCAGLWRDARHGDAFRLEVVLAHPPGRGPAWEAGQHFFLCFCEGGIWQSHPFTPLSPPRPGPDAGTVAHAYVVRAKRGETRRLAGLLARKMDAKEEGTTPVVLQGPYGCGVLGGGLRRGENVLCVAGGTGIAFAMAVLLQLERDRKRDRPGADARVELVWAVRRAEDTEWVRPEMERLLRTEEGAAQAVPVRVRVFVTDEEGKKESESAAVTRTTTGRPDVAAVVREFVDGVVRGPTSVFGSGPPGMMCDLREAVARCNDGASVWKGEERFDVRLTCDDRLE
ncbi:hypothetical protein P8C59_007703 [Phyllachora maydis]|uniref:FAD-binding FR-type domain-containing protein n=2 Tax=Phyllachora maydis TaxID=1825666 RepID=A0AAD9IAR4_9PEZI|nr:hypothetical protein P8C59_007703 [Phyllachora maydis]